MNWLCSIQTLPYSEVWFHQKRIRREKLSVGTVFGINRCGKSSKGHEIKISQAANTINLHFSLPVSISGITVCATQKTYKHSLRDPISTLYMAWQGRKYWNTELRVCLRVNQSGLFPLKSGILYLHTSKFLLLGLSN